MNGAKKPPLDVKQLQALIDCSPNPVLLIDGLQIADCNLMAVNWLGCTHKHELLNAHPAKLSSQLQTGTEPSMDKFNNFMHAATHEGDQRFDWVFQRSNGMDLYAEVSLQALSCEGGGCLLCTVYDTSRFRQVQDNLSRSNDRFRLMFDASPDPLWLVSGNLFIDCNNAAVKLMGYTSKADLLNKHPSELSPEFQPDGEDSFNKANRMGRIAWKQGVHRFEWMHKRFNGEDLFAEVVLTPIQMDAETVMYCAWHDISQRKKHEGMLMTIIADLQDKLDNASVGESQG